MLVLSREKKSELLSLLTELNGDEPLDLATIASISADDGYSLSSNNASDSDPHRQQLHTKHEDTNNIFKPRGRISQSHL